METDKLLKSFLVPTVSPPQRGIWVDTIPKVLILGDLLIPSTNMNAETFGYILWIGSDFECPVCFIISSHLFIIL